MRQIIQILQCRKSRYHRDRPHTIGHLPNKKLVSDSAQKIKKIRSPSYRNQFVVFQSLLEKPGKQKIKVYVQMYIISVFVGNSMCDM